MDLRERVEVGSEVAGRWRLYRQIGEGGGADVWAAEDLVLGRAVAVKLLRVGAGFDQRRFESEVYLLASVRHPRIVSLHDAGVADGRPYLVMDLVEGRSLDDRLREGPLPSAEVALLGEQLAEALDHLHRHGVVHRDVKPANVLLDAATARPGEPFSVVLADLGVSQLVDGDGATSPGLVVGTPGYLAPERLAGADATPASDVFALGTLLRVALTGRAADPEAVGGEWRDLLVAMTAADPSARPTLGDAVQAMRRAGATPVSVTTPAADASGAVVAAFPPRPTVAPPIRRRREGPALDTVTVALVAVAALLLAVWAFA